MSQPEGVVVERSPVKAMSYWNKPEWQKMQYECLEESSIRFDMSSCREEYSENHVVLHWGRVAENCLSQCWEDLIWTYMLFNYSIAVSKNGTLFSLSVCRTIISVTMWTAVMDMCPSEVVMWCDGSTNSMGRRDKFYLSPWLDIPWLDILICDHKLCFNFVS